MLLFINLFDYLLLFTYLFSHSSFTHLLIYLLFIYLHFQLLVDLERLSEPEKEFSVECAKVEGDTTLVSLSEVKRHLNFLQRYIAALWF